MKITTQKLDNQIEATFIHLPGASCSSVQFWFNAGSALEAPGDRGVAHFLEHMFFKGTPKRPGTRIVFDAESFGGEINAFTSFDYTCYYINAPNAKVLKSLDILSDMVSSPLFAHEDFPPERGVVLEEYLMACDDPQQYGFHRIQEKIFSANGYNHPILGGKKTIEKFNQRQVRSFRKNHYNRENFLLMVAGDLKDQARLKKRAIGLKLPKGKKNTFPSFRCRSRPVVDLYERDVKMAELTLVFNATDFRLEAAPQEDLAWKALGQGESSPLYEKMVKSDGLCQSATAFSYYLKTGGILAIGLSFPPEHTSRVLQRLREILEGVKFSHKELAKMKNQNMAAKVYEKESLEQYAFSWAHSKIQYGDPKVEDLFLKRAMEASLFDVQGAYQSILARPAHLSAQYPQGGLKGHEKSLEEFHGLLNQRPSAGPKKRASFQKSKYDPHFFTHEIQPGVRFVYRQNELAPTFVLQAYLKGGLCEETPQNNGHYGLMATLLPQGHSGKDTLQVKKATEALAASVGGFSGKNSYGLTLHGQTKDFDELLEHFQGHFLRPNFGDGDFEREREITLRSLESSKKDPTKVLFQLSGEKIFEGHPYALNPLGAPGPLGKLRARDLRDIHQKNLTSKEMVITYCGPQGPGQVLRALSGLAQGPGPRGPSSYRAYDLNTVPQDAHRQLDREQVHFFVARATGGLLAPGPYLRLLSSFLSGQSSELFVRLRDELGLCYSVSPVYFEGLQAGHWGVYMACSQEKFPQALKEVRHLLASLGQRGLTGPQFRRAKEQLKGQQQMKLQTNEDYALAYSVAVLHGLGMDHFYTQQKAIENMSLESFNKKLKALLTGPLAVFSVGRGS